MGFIDKAATAIVKETGTNAAIGALDAADRLLSDALALRIRRKDLESIVEKP